MDNRERLKLLHGPYSPPPATRGDVLACEYRGRDVKVGGMTDAPIQWPKVLKTGKASPIVCGDLVRAIRTESEIAVAYHWCVSIVTVWAWRKALDVPQVNEGTGRLYRDYKPEKLTDEVSALGRHRANEPEIRSKILRSKTGVPASPRTRAGLLEAAKRPKSEGWKQKARERMAGKRPPNPDRPEWTPEEDAILGTAPDRSVSARLGRTIPGVRGRRKILGIPAYRS